MFYQRFLEGQWNQSPYYSLSSTSPVAAGVVALLKEVNNQLKPAEYKRVIVETSKEVLFKDQNNGSEFLCPKVVDAGTAVRYLLETHSDENDD